MKEFNRSTSTLNFRLQIFGWKKKRDPLYEMLYIVSKSGLRRLVFYPFENLYFSLCYFGKMFGLLTRISKFGLSVKILQII